MKQFIENNWKSIVMIIFTLGMIYAKLDGITKSLEDSTGNLKEHERRIQQLEISSAENKTRYEEIMRSLQRIEKQERTRR